MCRGVVTFIVDCKRRTCSEMVSAKIYVDIGFKKIDPKNTALVV